MIPNIINTEILINYKYLIDIYPGMISLANSSIKNSNFMEHIQQLNGIKETINNNNINIIHLIINEKFSNNMRLNNLPDAIKYDYKHDIIIEKIQYKNSKILDIKKIQKYLDSYVTKGFCDTLEINLNKRNSKILENSHIRYTNLEINSFINDNIDLEVYKDLNINSMHSKGLLNLKNLIINKNEL